MSQLFEPPSIPATVIPVVPGKRWEVLVQSSTTNPGRWVFPGGRLRSGREWVWDAAMRECFEESGERIDEKTLHPIGVVPHLRGRYKTMDWGKLADGADCIGFPRELRKRVIRTNFPVEFIFAGELARQPPAERWFYRGRTIRIVDLRKAPLASAFGARNTSSSHATTSS